MLVFCHPESAPAEQKFVTVRLHDSLSRFDRVEVTLLAADDTSAKVGQVWSGPLSTPSAIPAFRLADTETRALMVRVKAYDSAGKLVLDQLIRKEGGKQVIASLLPAPVPVPDPPDTSKGGPVVRPPSSRLKSLAIQPGALSPAFDSTEEDYKADFAYEQSAVIFTAVPVTDSARLTIEGLRVMPGTPSDPFELHVGVNELAVRVTVGDSSRLYSVKIDRARRVDPPDTSKPGDGDPAYKAWTRRAKVEVNVPYLGLERGTTVRDFPLLIRLTRDNFDFGEAAAGGRDIRLVRNGAQLDHHVNRWDVNAEAAEIWVRIDTIHCDKDFAPITMYWGNPAATGSFPPEKVFPPSAGHNAVWHLDAIPQGLADEFRDATGRYHGRGGRNGEFLPKRLVGVVGNGQRFGLNGIPGSIDIPAAFDPGERWSFQAWIKTEGPDETILFEKREGWAPDSQRFQLGIRDGAGQQLQILKRGDGYVTGIYMPRGAFLHVAINYEAGRTAIFVDGYERETVTGGWTQGTGKGGISRIGMGCNQSNNEFPFNGMLDELWFATEPRSKEWIRIAFENQRAQSFLVVVGDPSANGGADGR